MVVRFESSPARSTHASCTRARRRVLLSDASRSRAYLRTICCITSEAAAVQDRATDSACPAVAARARSEGRRAERAHACAAPAVVRRPDSARRRASPNSARAVAAGTVHRSRCTRAGSRAGRSVAGRAGSAADGAAAAGAARRRGAARPRRTLAAVTSSVHTRRGVHGWSPGRHSWRGWPTPAHSPIRPPPSTRRDIPADDGAGNCVVSDARRGCWCWTKVTSANTLAWFSNLSSLTTC